MKNKIAIWIIMPIIIFGMYLLFYSKIATKPSDAGFWFILALGISIGVFIGKIFKK